jgi:hypothetical protein
MVWDAKTSWLGNVPHIYFLLLIIRNISFSSSSSESLAILYSLARICLGDLFDKKKGHLACCSHSLNYDILTPNVKASYTKVVYETYVEQMSNR